MVGHKFHNYSTVSMYRFEVKGTKLTKKLITIFPPNIAVVIEIFFFQGPVCSDISRMASTVCSWSSTHMHGHRFNILKPISKHVCVNVYSCQLPCGKTLLIGMNWKKYAATFRGNTVFFIPARQVTMRKKIWEIKT